MTSALNLWTNGDVVWSPLVHRFLRREQRDNTLQREPLRLFREFLRQMTPPRCASLSSAADDAVHMGSLERASHTSRRVNGQEESQRAPAQAHAFLPLARTEKEVALRERHRQTDREKQLMLDMVMKGHGALEQCAYVLRGAQLQDEGVRE